MVEAAAKASVKTLVGFNYMKNPTSQLAKEIIARGEIGEVVHFYGTHNEDYLAKPDTPLDWHCQKALAGLGALGDLAAHIVNMAHYLVGNIVEVSGDMMTVIRSRPDPKDLSRQLPVENEDQASALLRFQNRAHGVIETSRIACGAKMGLTYVVTGTKGTLRYTQERMAELELYLHDEPAGRQGFKTILTGPAHPDYASFCVSAGHGIGFNDQKTVEIRDLINGVAAGDHMWPDFAEGLQVQKGAGGDCAVRHRTVLAGSLIVVTAYFNAQTGTCAPADRQAHVVISSQMLCPTTACPSRNSGHAGSPAVTNPAPRASPGCSAGSSLLYIPTTYRAENEAFLARYKYRKGAAIYL